MVQLPAGLTVPRSPSSPAGTRSPPAGSSPGPPDTSALDTSAAEATGPGTGRKSDHGLAHWRPGPADRRAIRPHRGRLPRHRHRAGGRPAPAGVPGPARHRGVRAGRAAPGRGRPAALPLAEPGGRRPLRHRRHPLPARSQRAGQRQRDPRADPLVVLDPRTRRRAPGRGGDHPPARAARPPGIPVRPGTRGVVPAGPRSRPAGQHQRAQPGFRRGPVRDRLASVPDRRDRHRGRVRPQPAGRAVAAVRREGHPGRHPPGRDRHGVRFPHAAAHRRHPARPRADRPGPGRERPGVGPPHQRGDPGSTDRGGPGRGEPGPR